MLTYYTKSGTVIRNPTAYAKTGAPMYTTKYGNARNNISGEIVDTCPGFFSDKVEQKHTDKNIKKHGYTNVRGGKYTNSHTLTENKKVVTCFKCGKKGHYANNCHNKNNYDSISEEDDLEPWPDIDSDSDSDSDSESDSNNDLEPWPDLD